MNQDGRASSTEQADPATIAHFRILGRLGAGGMGVVYRAEDETLRRIVAVKVLADASGNEERRQRFLREARSAAAISHPNVAVVHQIGDAAGRIYIAMELVEGESLRARLERGRLDLATAREVALQIARGLSAAHDKGIVHRDLKPENVMVTPSGVVKLLDFGLAKTGAAPGPPSGDPDVAYAKTETVVTSDEGRIMGTPEYMSPEQAMGEPLDVRSDVFSFGTVLYEMLSGARPFTGSNVSAALVAIARDEPQPLRGLGIELDAATEAVVARCLAKAPSARFSNAGEIVAALSGTTSPAATTASRTDVAPITRAAAARSGERRSRRAVITIAIAAAALALGALGWRLKDQTRALAPPVASSPVDAAVAGPPHGKAITDHPLPVTGNAEAATAYAAALQDIRDGSLAVAEADVNRAIRLDPSLAAARLRRVWWRIWTPDDESIVRAREDYAGASQRRGSLDDRDLLFLHAAEAVTRDPTDWSDVAARFRAVLDRFPDDAEALLCLGAALSNDGQQEDARRVLEQAVVVDSRFGGALWKLAATYMRDSPLKAKRSLDRCIEVSPSAASCVRNRAELHADEGQCGEMEADARRMTVIEPTGDRAYLYLAMALAARGAPIESVRSALDKRLALVIATGSNDVNHTRLENDLAIAAVTGNLEAMIAAAHGLELAVVNDTSEAAQIGPILAEIHALEEEGETAKALKVAETAESRSSAWTLNAPEGLRLYLLYAHHQTGTLPDAPFREAREELAKDAATRWTAESARDAANLFFSRYAVRADEIRDVLDRANEPPLMRWSWGGAYFGRALFLGGRADDALPLLERGAAACDAMRDFNEWRAYDGAFFHVHANLWLGQARESKGDKPGACAAYAVVLDQWKNAKPRSVTLEKAKERSRALGCGR